MNPISIVGKKYKSVEEASRLLNIPVSRIYTRLNSDLLKWSEWSFLDGNKHSVKTKKDTGLSYVYKLVHNPTGRFYIGSTKDYLGRKATHLWGLRNRRHNSPKLQELWNSEKNEDSWTWHVWVFEDRQRAYEEEQKYLVEYAGSPLLLNTVTDARSPISDLINRDGFKQMLAVSRSEHLNNLTEEESFLLKQKWSVASKRYWDTGNNRQARTGAGNPFAKKVMIDGVTYGSVKDAERTLKISEKTIRKRANSPEYPNYSFPT